MNQILFFTGAGLSAESGISTFRDNVDGVWTVYDPEVVANLYNFHENKEIVFKFYNERRIAAKEIQPNDAHRGIAEIQKKHGKDVVKIFTQNVDDLLERAGCEDVVHVHGKITEMLCMECDHVWDIGHTVFNIDSSCPSCGQSGSIKPGVIFFHEIAPEYQKMINTFQDSEKDVVVVIGTSFEVIPQDLIIRDRSKNNRSTAILNNIVHDKYGKIDYNDFDICLFSPASEVIKTITNIVDRRHAELCAQY
jgi:NAD-dependent deacetylase